MNAHNKHGFATGYEARKNQPLVTGVLDYFPLAILAIAEVSNDGNAQHNPGEPLHWAREKSQDEVNTLARHLLERGDFDGNVRHLAKAAWRVLAALQKEIEASLCIDGSCEVHHGDGKDHGGSCSLLPRAATWYGRTRDHAIESRRTLCAECESRSAVAKAQGKYGFILCPACVIERMKEADRDRMAAESDSTSSG
jgi:hypothetical protein